MTSNWFGANSHTDCFTLGCESFFRVCLKSEPKHPKKNKDTTLRFPNQTPSYALRFYQRTSPTGQVVALESNIQHKQLLLWLYKDLKDSNRNSDGTPLLNTHQRDGQTPIISSVESRSGPLLHDTAPPESKVWQLVGASFPTPWGYIFPFRLSSLISWWIEHSSGTARAAVSLQHFLSCGEWSDRIIIFSGW